MTNPEPPFAQLGAVGRAPEAMEQAAIGVFDSGLGGLSVWREIVRRFPCENTLYFGDQGHIPYGPRSLEEIRAFSQAITEFLLAQGAKMIVVACNTASGAALHTLRERFPHIQFVGMEPAVKPAAERSSTGVIGVLATPTTFEGALFQRLVDRFGQQVAIHTQICPGLVEAVEAGTQSAPETHALLRSCLAPLMERGIDQLVLGCTHYPFLRETIEQILGPRVTVVDPAPAVAAQVGRVLGRQAMLNRSNSPGTHLLYTSGPSVAMREMAHSLLGYTGRVATARWRDFELHACDAEAFSLTEEPEGLYSSVDDVRQRADGELKQAGLGWKS
jgi:glutamate racemase